MTTNAGPGTGRLAASILGLVLLGTPPAAFLWHALNHLLSGIVRPVELLLAIPCFVLFVGVLLLIARFVRSTEAERHESTSHT
jgi:hypothetical protein